MQRHHALHPKAMLSCLGVLALISSCIAGVFWLQGAKMIAVFAGLEWAALLGALAWHLRHAGDLEALHWSGNILCVETERAGVMHRTQFHPAWVRIDIQPAPSGLIELSGQGQRVMIGRFLRHDQRLSLVKTLRQALAGR